MSTLHLVIGSTGAGKSTYSRQLERELPAARFAIDEWMQRLYLPDRPEDADPSWYLARIERATEVILETASRVVALGSEAVLEIGMTARAERERFYRRVQERGIALKLHVLDAPAHVRWERVQARNRARGDTFAMEVTRPMFDYVEGMWEPPDDEELRRTGAVRVDTSGTAPRAAGQAAGQE